MITTQHTSLAVDALLRAVEAGDGVPEDLYAQDAVLDATVPRWRLEAHGPAAICAQLSSWFADPATLTEVRRLPFATGEMVSFTLAWSENDAPMAGHQIHVVNVDAAGRISRQEAWCGGRWEAALQADIEVGLQRARRP